MSSARRPPASSPCLQMIGKSIARPDEGAVRLRLRELARRVDARLPELLPAATERPEQVHAAMLYAAASPGKRLRPVLRAGGGRDVRRRGGRRPSTSPARSRWCTPARWCSTTCR